MHWTYRRINSDLHHNYVNSYVKRQYSFQNRREIRERERDGGIKGYGISLLVVHILIEFVDSLEKQGNPFTC